MNLRRRSDQCLSDLALDRVVVGERNESEIAAHLAACATCRERLAELKQANQRFIAEELSDLARQRRKQQRTRRIALVSSLSTVAAAAALLLVFVKPEPEPTVRLKGGFQLELIARHTDGRVEQVLPGGALAPGEAIRFRLSTDQAGFVGIIGIDSARNVTAYAPSAGTTQALSAGRQQLLDGSIILDETLGAERVVAVLCSKPMDVATLIAAGKKALERAHQDPKQVVELGTGCREASALFTKRAP